ncbi:MAG: hypothetical protein QNI87_02110 [Erythrobacter sp.]|uniref:hypothetical protein n=1 Tax=Erythrobacter sp. TaxID=1042 RepID=UPI00261E8E01|nr:hypothetical protein [Erythrobacter sp.]MDJ0977308.1 hypothetical protein [Erythrobacter sp.]
MKWVRVSDGLWFVWPPRQFSTEEPNGLNIWRNNNGRDDTYKPDRPSHFASMDLPAPEYCIPEKPVSWHGDHQASWDSYPDGRTFVKLSKFDVAFERAKVSFRFARSFLSHELGYYYPEFIDSPPIAPACKWAAGNFGARSSPNAEQRIWHYPTPDGRRWVGTFDIEPEGLTFHRLSELPPPFLPSDKEVAAELATIEEEKKWAGDLWPLSQMQRDMAESDEFMELIRVDDFARQFRLFFMNNEMVHLRSGKRVRTTTDDTGAWLLADLRCYHERWQQCDHYPREGEDPAARDTIVRLFAEVGYAPLEVEFDGDAYLERLRSIWETMPLKVKRVVLAEDGKVQALVLAWAMGEFWSQENGWITELQDGSSEEIRLRGGHIPDAIKIAQMVEEGLLSDKST